MTKLMDDKEIAEYTGLSRWTINELRRRGEIPYIKLKSIRRFYYNQVEIDAWIAGMEHDGVKPQTNLSRTR